MGYIASWLNDATQNKVADMIVDETLADLQRREKILDLVMPMKMYDSRNFLGYVLDEVNLMASVVGYGVDTPLTSQGSFRKITAELLKTSLGRMYGEEDQWRMKEAMAEAAMKGIYVQSLRDPNTGAVIQKGTNDTLAKYIFGTVESLVRAQINVLDKMTWEVLQTGEINHLDSRTGTSVTISYKNPYDVSYNNFPAALAGGDAWNQYATANGLQNLDDDITAFVDLNGYPPEAIAMSRNLLSDLMQQQSTKDAATQVRGASVGTVGQDMLAATLTARQLPHIITFDERYSDEAEDKSLTKVRFLADNRYVFLTKEMGVRAIGPTLENESASGIYVTTREVKQGSPVDISESVATLLPAVANPKLLYSRQVKA